MARKASNNHNGTNGHGKTAFPALSSKSINELTQAFKLLSDEARLRILVYLAQAGELHVTDLCNRLNQSQPAVSHHLALLRVAGIIESRREGKFNFYRVSTHFLNDLLRQLLESAGTMPRKLTFEDFVLSYTGD